MPFSQTILVAGIIHWFHDIWKIILFKGRIEWRLFFYFGMPALITSIIGARFLLISSDTLLFGLGIFLIIYAVILIAFPLVTLADTKRNALIGGTISGFFAGIFGIRGAISSMFLAAFDLKKAVYISTVGAISLMIDSGRIFTYFSEGIRLDDEQGIALIFMVITSFAGSWIGSQIVHRIPQDQFRRIVAIFLLLAGIRLLFIA